MAAMAARMGARGIPRPDVAGVCLEEEVTRVPNKNELPKERWNDYLSALSNRQANKPVSVRIEGGGQGQKELGRMPLVGISCELKGSEADAIEITLGDIHKNMENITHMVDSPEHIYVEDSDQGDVSRIDIESKAKVKTVLFFQESKETAQR